MNNATAMLAALALARSKNTNQYSIEKGRQEPIITGVDWGLTEAKTNQGKARLKRKGKRLKREIKNKLARQSRKRNR